VFMQSYTWKDTMAKVNRSMRYTNVDDDDDVCSDGEDLRI